MGAVGGLCYCCLVYWGVRMIAGLGLVVVVVGLGVEERRMS
jgi:hypothetical protein